jgi:hypothetical protein
MITFDEVSAAAETREVARQKVAEYNAARGRPIRQVHPGEDISTLQINFPREQSIGELIVRGSPEYIEQARDAVIFAVGQIAKNFGVPRPIVTMIGEELQKANKALRLNESFDGDFVFVAKWRRLE